MCMFPKCNILVIQIQQYLDYTIKMIITNARVTLRLYQHWFVCLLSTLLKKLLTDFQGELGNHTRNN